MITCAALTLGLTLGSYHLDREARFEEFNPGAYAICDNWTGGVYRNSLGRASAFAGYAFSWGPFSLGLGVVSGYQRTLMPMVLPSVKIGAVRVGIIPPPEPKARGALTVSVEMGF